MKFKVKTSLFYVIITFLLLSNSYSQVSYQLFKECLIKADSLRLNFQNQEAINLLEQFQTSLDINSNGYSKKKSTLLSHLLYLYDEVGDYSKAITAGKELMLMPEVSKKIMSMATTCLGTTYDHMGEKAIALDYYLKAQKLYVANGELKQLHYNYNNIAGIYHFLDDYNQALINYFKAIKSAKENSNINLAGYYRNISRVYLSKKEYQTAISYLDSAIYMADFYKDIKEQSIVLGDYGAFYYDLEQFDSALYYYQRSFDIKVTMDRKVSLLYSIKDISKTNNKLKRFSKAISLSKSGLEEAIDTKNNEFIRDFSENLFDSYQAIGDYENAVKYHVLYKNYYDSLVNEEKSRDLLRTQIRFETEQKETENQLLKQQDITNQETIRAQNQFMVLLVSAIVIFMFIAIIAYRAYIINKRLSKKIQHQSDKLQELDEAKSRFFANISHDLRSPLTLIMGSIEQVLGDKEVFLSNKAEKLLKTGYSNGERIIHLTNEINELIQLEDGKLKLDPKPTNPVTYLNLITGMFHSAAELKSIDLAFVNEIEVDKLKSIEIDVKQFEKVMFNLISNAFKHTQPEDSIHVILRQKNDTHYSIVIKDTGEGIPANNVPYIFDRYYQAPDTTFKTQEGFGIGLALVKEIVVKHQGKVWITSELGIGSEFGVDIKVGRNIVSTNEDETIDALTYIKEKQNIFGSLDNYITKDRPLINIDIHQNDEKSDNVVLIVEDHPEVREYIKSIVEKKYKVLEAIDGKRALDVLAKEKVNLIITDLMMPFFDGFELLEKLKDDEKLKTIPALVVSARTTEEDKSKVLSSGVNDFLSKPFNAQELLQRIHNLLNLKEAWNNTNEDAIFINSKLQLDDAQQSMIKKVESLIMNRIDDPNLSVLDLADEMAASERQVYRMIKKLTELTPFEYIKEVRWQYVQYLLKNNKVNNPSEAARAIGMNNVSHFKTQYKKRFGAEPSATL